jgi:hypothetical protein
MAAGLGEASSSAGPSNPPPPPAQWLAAQIRLLRRVVVGQGASWRILVAPLWATAASNTGSTPMGGKLSLDPTSAIAPPPPDADR